MGRRAVRPVPRARVRSGDADGRSEYCLRLRLAHQSTPRRAHALALRRNARLPQRADPLSGAATHGRPAHEPQRPSAEGSGVENREAVLVKYLERVYGHRTPRQSHMDPLTHTLVGANLAATRLGEKTRLATAAFVLGANLPDIDSWYYFTGQGDFALGFRRGWTHGVLALLVLPLLQTALLLLYARLRPDPNRPVHVRWLLILSA